MTHPVTSSLILDPANAAAAMVNAGFNKVRLPPKKMIVLGILAGFYLSFGGQVLAVINADFDRSDGAQPPTGAQRYLAGCAFSVGLIAILIASAELFTGNVMILMAVLAGRVTLMEMLWDWLVVYWSNFLGSALMAVIIYGGGLNGYYASVHVNDTMTSDMTLTRTGEVLCNAAKAKAELRPFEMFFRGIPANMLVCLAVICATASKSAIGKVFTIALPIGTFIASGFEHSIANMYTFSMATLLNCNNGADHGLYWLNLLLVTIGNIVGASILAVSYWITFIADKQEEPATTQAQVNKIVQDDIVPTPLQKHHATTAEPTTNFTKDNNNNGETTNFSHQQRIDDSNISSSERTPIPNNLFPSSMVGGGGNDDQEGNMIARSETSRPDDDCQNQNDNTKSATTVVIGEKNIPGQ